MDVKKLGIIKVNSISTDIKSNATEVSVGKMLKQARQAHKVRDLNIIAEELCIKPYLLEALEQGDFASFPSSCYATGFLKNYASYLGMDTKEVVSRYEMEYAGSKECVVLAFPEAENYNKLPLKSMAGVATLCVVILAGVWTGFHNFKAEEAGDVAPSTNNRSMETNINAPAPPEAQEAVAISSDEVRLKATQDVWVRLSDQEGSIRVEKILAKGEDLIAPADEGLSLMTNNAAGLSVYVDGTSSVALGREGEIIESIKLEQEELLELSMLH